MPGIESFDWTLLNWLNNYALRVPGLDSLMNQMVLMRSLGFGLMMMALWYFWFQDTNRSSEVRSRVLTTLLSGLVALVVGRLLAEALPFRTRPFCVPGQLRPISDISGILRTWSSFPSDHAAMAFALSMGIWMIVRWAGTLAFLTSVFFISFPRVFLGQHYPSDVIGGAVIGILVCSWMHSRLIRVRVSAFLKGLERSYSGAFYVTLFMIMYEITRMFDDIRRPVSVFFDLLHQTTSS